VADARKPDADGEDAPEAAKTADDSALARAVARPAFAWARDGVDEVLILRAATYDEARAQVGLLDAALRQTVALPSLQLERLDEATRAPSPQGGSGEGGGGGGGEGRGRGAAGGRAASDPASGVTGTPLREPDSRPAAEADGSPRPPEGAVRTAVPQGSLALGSFVLEDLDGERFGRLAELAQVLTEVTLEARQGSLRDAAAEDVSGDGVSGDEASGDGARRAKGSAAPTAPAGSTRGAGAAHESPDKAKEPTGSGVPASPVPASPVPASPVPPAAGPPAAGPTSAPPAASAPASAPVPAREEPERLRRVRIVVLPR
jgi:hypothetical protein